MTNNWRKNSDRKYRLHLILLFGWLLVGTILRFTNLSAKPPWSDEWATIVFSLGHSFRTIPLNTLISLDNLLQPLIIDRLTQPQDVIQHLMRESTHPPLYFLVSHWWLQWWGSDRLVSIWWARSLSALLGVVSIPAMFGLGWLLFRNAIAAQLSAALMAVSPLGIYLAQEARHYTLAVLWVIASLACLNLAIRSISAQRKPSLRLITAWIIVNSLGMATHYFFALTLVAEILVLLSFWLKDWHKGFKAYWVRIYWAIFGTLGGCVVWMTTWRGMSDNQLTSWVFTGNTRAEFLEPLLSLLAWWINMLFLLPVEGVPSWVIILSSTVVIGVLIWLIPLFCQGWQACRQSDLINQEINILSRFLASAIALILAFTYLIGADLTISARFQFFYFPAVLLLVGVILAYLWQQPSNQNLLTRGKYAVLVTLFMGLLGSLTITNNFAYQKVERPDLVVPAMVEAHQNLETPLLIATIHQTHGQTGEMMGLAWQLRQFIDLKPQFLLAHADMGDEQKATQILIDAISDIPRPFQLWLVNFSPSENIKDQGCETKDAEPRKAKGYRYRLYNCNI